MAYPAASETLNPYSLPIILFISKIMPSYMWVNNSGGGIQFICHHSHHTLGGRNWLYSLDLNAVLCSSGPEAMSLSMWSLSILMAAHAVILSAQTKLPSAQPGWQHLPWVPILLHFSLRTYYNFHPAKTLTRTFLRCWPNASNCEPSDFLLCSKK